MSRWLLPWLVVLANINAGTQPDLRSQYQQVVGRNYPGFRVLQRQDFDVSHRGSIADGTTGSLVVGRFNFDGYEDFAALIVPAKATRYEAGRGSYDYYAGKLIVCFGDADKAFRCEAEDRNITLPHDTVLERVSPGRYQCHGGRAVTTEIDSVGEASEKAGDFVVRNRDGSSRVCVTAD
jgi:hypothetical protein